jgi:hypothetical protein
VIPSQEDVEIAVHTWELVSGIAPADSVHNTGERYDQ